jgi:predicted membrane channel-forming protein YqfA (hemolysin III family)
MRVNTRMTPKTSLSLGSLSCLVFAPLIVAGLAVFAAVAVLGIVAWMVGAAVYVTGKGVLCLRERRTYHPAHR